MEFLEYAIQQVATCMAIFLHYLRMLKHNLTTEILYHTVFSMTICCTL